ncbi:hypothetical protein BKE38_22770 [Pseudoroseomonas deserti]|uniref:Uncharacterized protein n=1 Tax=Teichococcus deserti TaxID=1817963 RepID=A0A1V2GWG8_9PROT|nr:hypothetical protein [Pseudoroseomonas deserti]ONG47719.1 hypothetical protein BKE38_22770 [Pseudoroseomonas deserti]
MFLDNPPSVPAAAEEDAASARGFLALAGEAAWRHRMADLARQARPRSWQGRAAQQRHALELLLSRLADPAQTPRLTRAEAQVLSLAREAVRLSDTLPELPRARLRERLLDGLTGQATLIPLFHLLREASRQRARGFDVHFAGLADEAPYDLRLERDGAVAELACRTVSAEEGRHMPRGDWFALVDGINPDLQTWLAAHPGRYLLKMTVPEGIQSPAERDSLQRQVSSLLASERRQDASEAAILKLDPLTIAGVQAAGLPRQLRDMFGPDAHLAVTGDPAGGSVFVMAAHAGRENALAATVVRHLAEAAATRLTGRHPGIVSIFLEEVERAEWRGLRDTLELEGAVRRFFTTPAAARLAAAACSSRFELFGLTPPDAAEQGELRFRNQAHPAAGTPGLQAAIASFT